MIFTAAMRQQAAGYPSLPSLAKAVQAELIQGALSPHTIPAALADLLLPAATVAEQMRQLQGSSEGAAGVSVSRDAALQLLVSAAHHKVAVEAPVSSLLWQVLTPLLHTLTPDHLALLMGAYAGVSKVLNHAFICHRGLNKV